MRLASLSILALGVLALAAPAPAAAEVIDFENLYLGWEGYQPLPAGYAGMTWNWASYSVTKYALAGTGYEYGTLGNVSLFTASAATIEFSGAEFDFDGAYLTAAWGDQSVLVEGLRDGVVVYATTIPVTTTQPTWADLNWTGVTGVRFDPLAAHLVIDNITINSRPIDIDADDDTVPDAADNCVNDANEDQADLDIDGEGDACDLDDDGDLVDDGDDNCAVDANADQADSDDDGAGDICDEDDDDDGIDDLDDNCALIENGDQADTDGDGGGDACDDDDDADGVLDGADACAGTPMNVSYNSDGCSGAQYVALTCGTGAGASNHGEYVSCVAHAANDARDAGLLTDAERAGYVRSSARKK